MIDKVTINLDLTEPVTLHFGQSIAGAYLDRLPCVGSICTTGIRLVFKALTTLKLNIYVQAIAFLPIWQIRPCIVT